MIKLIKQFLSGNKSNIKKLYQDGAVIIDVRMPQEYASGHIKEAINVPLQSLNKEMGMLKKIDKPVITCCLSGRRSAVATNMLVQQGINAHNGGGWQSLQLKVKQL